MYQTLARALFFFHMFLFVPYLLFGGLIPGAGPKMVHNIILGTTILSQLIFMGCPLTVLEEQMRLKHNPNATPYYGSYTVHLIHKYTGIKIRWYHVTVVLILFATSQFFVPIFE